MTAVQASPPTEVTIQAPKVFRVSMTVLVLGLITNALIAIAALQANAFGDSASRLVSVVWTLYTVVAGISAWLSRRGRARLAVWLIIGGLAVAPPFSALIIANLGIVLGLGLVVIGLAIVTQLGLPPRATRAALITLGAALLLTIALDFFGPAGRPAAPPVFRTLLPVIVGLITLGFSYSLMRQFGSYSIRTKLIIGFLAVTLVPLGLLAFLNDRAARASLTSAANRSLFAAASETATNVDAFVGANLDAVTTESQLPVFAQYLDLAPEARAGSITEIDANALLIALRNKEVRSLPLAERFSYHPEYSLLDQNGNVLLSTYAPSIGLNFADRGFFTLPFLGGQPFISQVEFTASDAEGPSPSGLYFSGRIFSPRLGRAGVLVARFDGAVLQVLVDNSTGLAGERSSAILLDENHIRLGDGEDPEFVFQAAMPLEADKVAALRAVHRLPNWPDTELATNLPELETGLKNVEAQLPFAVETHPGEGLDQAVVVELTTRPWLVVYQQTQSVFLAPAEAQTRNTLLLALVLAVFAAAAAVGMAQLLAGPIARLTAVAADVTAGDLTARAAVQTQDEIGALANAFNGMTSRLRDLIGNLESRVNERTAHLQAAADIGRATTSVRNLDEMLRLALDLIRDRFHYYHASMFLTDETGRYAVLRDSTGEVGAILKASGYRLEIGSQSLIGWVTQNRKPRVASDVGEDPFYLKHPLLPHTRSEAAFPLMVGNTLLGALDIQSRDSNAFGPAQVQVLQTVADQLSVAIESAQLFQRTQASLAEVSSLYQQITGAGWRAIARERPQELVYQIQPGQAGATGDGGAPIVVPLRLRGQVVGTMELHGAAAAALGPEEQAVLDTAAAQLGVAFESAVLFEEAQRRGRRDQLISQIADQMRATLNQSAVMQSGIRELGRALGATEVIVKLTPGGSAPGRKAEE